MKIQESPVLIVTPAQQERSVSASESVSIGSLPDDQAPLIFMGFIPPAQSAVLSVLEVKSLEDSQDPNSGTLFPSYPLGLPMVVAPRGKMSAWQFLLSLASAKCLSRLKPYYVDSIRDRETVACSMFKREMTCIRLGLLRGWMSSFLANLSSLSEVPRKGHCRQYLSGMTGEKRGHAFYSYLSGRPMSFNLKWTSQEKGERLVVAQFVNKSHFSISASSISVYQKDHACVCPILPVSGNPIELTVGRGTYMMPNVIFLQSQTFGVTLHPEARRPIAQSNQLFEFALQQLRLCHGRPLFRLPSLEMTYLTGVNDVRSVVIMPRWSPSSCYFYFNLYGFSLVVCGMLRPEQSRIWNLTVMTVLTSYETPLLKAGRSLAGGFQTVLTFQSYREGGKRKHVSAIKAVTRKPVDLVTQRGPGKTTEKSIHLEGGPNATDEALAKICTAVLMSEPWSGIPYVSDLVTHSRCNSTPIDDYEVGVLDDAYARSLPQMESLVNVDELHQLFNNHTIKTDGDEVLLIHPGVRLNPDTGEEEKLRVRTVTVERVIGRMIIDAFNMYKPIIIDHKSGAELGTKISKSTAEVLYRPPSRCLVEWDGVTETHVAFMSHTHSVNCGFTGKYGHKSGSIPHSPTSWSNIELGNLYDIPDVLGSTHVQCWAYPYSSEKELTDLLCLLGDRVGGMSVESDYVLFDTPCIIEAKALCERLKRNVYFRTTSQQYIVAWYGGINADNPSARVFASNNANSSVTGLYKVYYYNDSGIPAPFRSLPPDELFDFRSILSKFEVFKDSMRGTGRS